MDLLFPSLLLSLWLKTFINGVVVTVQRRYMIGSFSGFFCVSLALLDGFLSLILTAIYCLEDFNISGWHLTRYHVCLLVQIACFVCSVLHWPVFLLGMLDSFWTLSPVTSHVSWVQKLTYGTGAGLLWILAACYVFWVADVVLLLEDDRNECNLLGGSESFQVLSVLLLTVTCVILYSFTPYVKPRIQVFQHSTRESQQTRSLVLRQIVYTFLEMWAPFIILMIGLASLRMELNAYLQLNIVWLCFLNSFSVAMALCSRSFTFDFENKETVTDGFCCWSFYIIYKSDTADNGPIQELDRRKLESHDEGKLQFV